MYELEPIVRDHEPLLALSGGDDGLSSCREVISASSNSLSRGGWLLLEHHYDQSAAVLQLMRNAGFKEVQFGLDIEGTHRFAICRHP